MIKGEITVSKAYCKGCGLCVEFCPRGCIEIPGDKLSDLALPLALFVEPDLCTACAVCGWMCPERAIEVYRVEDR